MTTPIPADLEARLQDKIAELRALQAPADELRPRVTTRLEQLRAERDEYQRQAQMQLTVYANLIHELEQLLASPAEA